MRCKPCNNQVVSDAKARLGWKPSGGALFLAAFCPTCDGFLRWVSPRSKLAERAPPKPDSVEVNRELF